MCFPGWVWGFFTFYELDSSSRWSIRSGMREARKRNCEGKHCCCCSHPPKTFFAGEGKPPLAKSLNAFSDSHPSWERRKSPMRKKGGKGLSPTAHSQFRLLHPLLTSQTTKEVRYQELRACRHSSTLDCVKYIMNMKYAKCNMQREGPAGWAGFESMSY